MALLAPDPQRITLGGAEPAPDRVPPELAAGTPEPLRSQLAELVGEPQVLGRVLDLVRYASDASPYRVLPKAVVVARDAADVAKLMRFSERSGIPLTFRSGRHQPERAVAGRRHPRRRPPPLLRRRRRGRRARGAGRAGDRPRPRQPGAGRTRHPARARPRLDRLRDRRRRDRQQLGRDALRDDGRLVLDGDRGQVRAAVGHRDRHPRGRTPSSASPPPSPSSRRGCSRSARRSSPTGSSPSGSAASSRSRTRPATASVRSSTPRRRPRSSGACWSARRERSRSSPRRPTRPCRCRPGRRSRGSTSRRSPRRPTSSPISSRPARAPSS